MNRTVAMTGWLLALVACGPGFDAGSVDPRPKIDSEIGDAGAAVDAGSIDAGPERDAGVTDAGVTDAGATDAGIATVSQPARACLETKGEVFAAEATDAGIAKGAVLACHFEKALSVEQVNDALEVDPAAASAVDVYLFAYRTTRVDGTVGTSTGRVLLPKTPRAGPLPAIVIGHPSVGLADKCAPSLENAGAFPQALPWAARGYAVAIPDFAGLGNKGVQGYVDNHDTGYSTLDAVRALRAFVPAGAIDSRALLIGYSQGGGAVLAAQGLEKSYGSGGTLTAVAAVAAEYFTRMNSFGYVTALRDPNKLTVALGYTKPVVAALRQYAFFFNRYGAASAPGVFPAVNASGTVAAMEQRCLIDFGGWLPSNRMRVKDWVDESLRTTFLACVDGAGGCAAPGSTLYAGLQADLVAPDPAGARVLYVQGGSE